MDGILLINKEKNMTSRDVVNIISKELKTKKVGHTGTLDPNATGVLVIALGKYLKLVDDLTALDKIYEAEITLGINTDTLDSDGIILEKKKVDVNNEIIDKVLKKFVGKYNMEVPIYSAIKVNGKKLYEYARNNEKVILPIKEVFVYDLKRISDIKDNKFKILCHVSKGTYIRSLVRDISKELNTVGIMSNLNRIKQGNFKIEDCYSIDDIKNNNYKLLNINDLNIDTIDVDEQLYTFKNEIIVLVLPS